MLTAPAVDADSSTAIAFNLRFSLVCATIMLLVSDLERFQFSSGAVCRVEDKSGDRLLCDAVTESWDSGLIKPF